MLERHKVILEPSFNSDGLLIFKFLSIIIVDVLLDMLLIKSSYMVLTNCLLRVDLLEYLCF